MKRILTPALFIVMAYADLSCAGVAATLDRQLMDENLKTVSWLLDYHAATAPYPIIYRTDNNKGRPSPISYYIINDDDKWKIVTEKEKYNFEKGSVLGSEPTAPGEARPYLQAMRKCADRVAALKEDWHDFDYFIKREQTDTFSTWVIQKITKEFQQDISGFLFKVNAIDIITELRYNDFSIAKNKDAVYLECPDDIQPSIPVLYYTKLYNKSGKPVIIEMKGLTVEFKNGETVKP